MKRWSVLVIVLVVAFLLAEAHLYAAPKVKITSETLFIDATDPGIKLHVRNKHAVGKKTFAPDKVVLFVHGATPLTKTSTTRLSAGRNSGPRDSG